MERYFFRSRFRSPARLILPSPTLALALVAATVGACASPLDKARTVWSDGEGDFDEAEPLYKDAVDNAKTREEATDELVAIYVKLGRENKDRFKIADDYYEKALALDPNDEAALEGRARVMIARGMPDEAFALIEKGVKSGSCRGCRPLYTVLLIDRADRYYAAQMYAEAEREYTQAEAILPNAAIALAIVRSRIALKQTNQAAEGLVDAAALIGVADTDQRKQFLELRRLVVLAVLAGDEPERADKLLDVAPSGVGAEEQLDLAIEVADELRRRGKADVALDRLETLAKYADEGKLKVSKDRIAELRLRVTVFYIAGSAAYLSKGQIDDADELVSRGLELRPDDAAMQLQRVLVVAGRGKIPEAEAALAKVDPKTGGYAEVQAILSTVKVHAHIEAGKLDAARIELDRAKARAKDLPEVHIATAELLSLTEAGGLKKKDIPVLRTTGLVKYPGGKVTRLAEALSELDWSKQSINGVGTTYPYRGPGTEQRIEALTKKLSESYPYAVKFIAAPQMVLALRTDGAAPLDVKLTCGAFQAEVKLTPKTPSRLTIPRPGLCSLEYGGKTAAWLAEPYAEVELPL